MKIMIFDLKHKNPPIRPDDDFDFFDKRYTLTIYFENTLRKRCIGKKEILRNFDRGQFRDLFNFSALAFLRTKYFTSGLGTSGPSKIFWDDFEKTLNCTHY